MNKRYSIALIVFVLFALVITYLQFIGTPESSGGVGIVGQVIASPMESATTFSALVIVFVLVWFTFGRKEE